MNQNLVSVVVPLFNAESHLEQALDSIAASSHARLEVLMIDDCSADNSGPMAKAYAGKDRRFRYYRNMENRNVSYSRNRGIGESRGDFIIFVDSDDRISPRWIENLWRDAVEYDAEVVIGKSICSEHGVESDYAMKGIKRRGELEFRSIVFKDNAVVWNKMYSAGLLKRGQVRFNEGLYIGEDLLFNFVVLGLARRIYYTDRGYYYYHADSSRSIMRSSTPSTRIDNLSKLLKLLVEFTGASGISHPLVLRKVAGDILKDYYRYPGRELDADVLGMICRIDRFLPVKTRLSLFRKLLWKNMLATLKTQFKGGSECDRR